jgi:hypothetical protein
MGVYMRTRLLLVFVGLCLFTGLSLAPAAAQAKARSRTASWTLMVYMDGDNNLESYITFDLANELAALGSSNAVQVVALADRTPGYDKSAGDWTSTKLFHVTQGMTAAPENAVADWGERDMGDPQTLIDFVTWAKATYRASHYALVLWDHGGMWRPDGTMWDDTSADGLDQDEITTALAAAGPVDVVGYDACQSATIEVAATWRPYCQAIAASEETIGMTGIEYDLVIAALRAYPAMTATACAVTIAESDTADPEFSAVALDAGFDALTAAVDQWAVALTAGLPAYRAIYSSAYRKTQNYYTPANVDLYDMAAEIQAQVGDPALQASCQAVMDAVTGVVLSERHAGRRYADSHGLTIFWPQRSQDLAWYDFDYYPTLRFAQLTQWDEFLSAYVR